MLKIEDHIPFTLTSNKTARESARFEVDHRNDAICLGLSQFSIRVDMSSECARELAAALNEHARQVEARRMAMGVKPCGST